MSNVLDPSSILHTLAQILPNGDGSQTQSKPLLRNNNEAIAAMSHAIMISVGFRLVGLGEDDHKIPSHQSKLPSDWNKHGPHSYTFQYTHPQSSLHFTMKGITLANKFIIHGVAIEDKKTATFEVHSEDYTSPSFYPYTTSTQEPLVNGFISSSRLNDFISLFKINILQRLIPGLNKPGYEESQSSTSVPTSRPEQSQPRNPLEDPRYERDRQRERIPRPPFFGDPLAGDEPYGPYGNPFSVGGDDLNPLGNLNRPFGRNPGGGMLVGPDHPMFRPGQSRQDPSSGIFGGPQPLPRGSVPPGARFDPIGPFGNNPNAGPQGSFGPGGSGPGRNFRGEPDNDELPPPGYDDMFL
ncbi:PI31 proteasome regulator N-terminal-domain-containing protein [Umbelopsis sp. PMI_123]|nr:PI31 proteasome regulator N-terminal-domain-containing protein [Umbelopsis sp. PMI_123]